MTADPSPRRWRWTTWAPPLGAFAASWAIVGLAALLGGYDPWEVGSWVRFDSDYYLSIARDGLSLDRCTPNPVLPCGTAGWFPLFPALVAAAGVLGVPLAGAGWALSNAALLGVLIVVWRASGSPVALAFAAFVPGVVYHHAVFPTSLAALGAVLCLMGLQRGSPWLAGAAGAIAAATYPTGVLLVVVMALWLALARRDLAVCARVRVLAIAGGLTSAGLGAALLAAQLQAGRWDAYFVVQGRRDHEIRLPLVTLWEVLQPTGAGPGGIGSAVALQGALVLVTVVLACGAVVLRRASARPLDWLLAIYVLVFWLVPMGQSGISVYRGDALLVPLGLLVARLPGRVAWTLVAAAAAIAGAMTLAFLQGVLT